jgi:hypothetical protein
VSLSAFVRDCVEAKLRRRAEARELEKRRREAGGFDFNGLLERARGRATLD